MRLTEDDVLNITAEKDLWHLRAEDVGHRRMTRAEWIHLLTLADAYWLHDGSPQAPHAELVSHGGKPGNHSNGFVNALALLTYSNIRTLVAQQIVDCLEDALLATRCNPAVRWVVGSDHAAASLSAEVGRLLNARHDFTEKGPGNSQIWKRFTIPAGEPVFQVEELSTDLKTPLAVRTGIREGNADPVTFVPFLGMFVSRCLRNDFEDGRVLALIGFTSIVVWTPEECARAGLCAQGSVAIKPKKNWARLTGRT